MIPSEYHFNLPTGELTLCLETPSRAGLDHYLHVAARLNPKRGFLFVSHLLGKHLPTPLGRLRKAHDLLARKLFEHLDGDDGDVLVVGMAETATLLGYGVWRTLASLMQGKKRQAHFLQTTRYLAEGKAWAFEESHSHAPQQWIQGLNDPAMARVRHVVLVDDELSTGRTFWALERVLRAHLPQVTDVQWACLTDFRPKEMMDHPAETLLKGTWSFKRTKDLPALDTVISRPVAPDQLRADFGRAQPLDWDGRAARLKEARGWLQGVPMSGRVLVVGTGEFMPLAMELAETIEEMPGVADVDFQATTRSPALMPVVKLGEDHYGEGVEQFIYNYDRSSYDTVVVFVETPPNDQTRALAQKLNATVLGPPALS